MHAEAKKRLIEAWYDGVSYRLLAGRFGITKEAVEDILREHMCRHTPRKRLRLGDAIRKVRAR